MDKKEKFTDHYVVSVSGRIYHDLKMFTSLIDEFFETYDGIPTPAKLALHLKTTEAMFKKHVKISEAFAQAVNEALLRIKIEGEEHMEANDRKSFGAYVIEETNKHLPKIEETQTDDKDRHVFEVHVVKADTDEDSNSR